ncbi:MFS transporter [Mycobacterium tuberculosis]|uniref:MFS transporter n=1 Tax=Mycobacterium tuberculosis TaxID=1773 RepID=UPI0005E59D72|nr:MFS transporter [Mycobacterium tuberculosis]CKL91010.1 multidrug resistance membrane efflux protein emrB [Mycobacterium tuberculosis]CKV92920.1 multidrug resistance membrane efflux protein emrB [Mycobacterium tuberculosis]
MLGNAMVEACPAEGDAPVPITPAGRPRSGQRSYPDRLDVGLLRTAGVCVLASVMAHVDVTVVSVAQRTFVADFGSTQAVVAWTMTGYMLALATVIPTAGWAADRFGTRRLFMGSVLAFTLGSLLCAVAPNILLLIIFRVVQGFGGGMLTPVSFAILAREAGPKRLGRVMAVVGIPMLLGPVGGPILGGWLIGAYGWRWVFLVNLPVGLSALVLAAIVFPRDRPAASENFDYMGLLLLSPGLATFLFGVSSSPARGTMADRHVLIPAITGLALIAAFVAHSWYRTEHPLIDMRLFQNRAVAQANMTMTVLSLGLFGSFLLLPSYLQQVLHQSPMQSGVHIIPQGLGAMLAMPIAGAMMDRRGPAKIVLVGIMLIAAGLGTFAFGVARQADYLPILPTGLAIMGMGMGCSMMPLSGAAVQTLAPHQIARGSTLISVNQQVGGSIGTALMSVLLTYQFNHSEIIATAKKVALTPESGAGRGAAVDPSSLPRQTNFAAQLLHDLSHAYAVVFVIATALVVSTLIPAAFLPKQQASHRRAPLLSA